MKKTKILLGVLSATVLAPAMPMMITSCNNSKRYDVQLFCNEGGSLVGEKTTFNVTNGTKWKDIQNKPTPIAKEGYKFTGWYRSETLVTDDTEITSNMDIYAWFEKESGTQCYVTILAGPGGTVTSTSIIPFQSGTKWGNIKPDDSAVTPDNSYNFVGWYMDDKLIDDETVLTENSYVFAWFENKTNTKCDIRFVNMNGGTFSGYTSENYPTQTIDKNTKWKNISKKPTTIAKDSYKFEGWYVWDEKVTDDTVFTDTTYIFAYFEKSEVKITIDTAEHGTIVSQPSKIGVGTLNSMRTTLDQCVKPNEGYALCGWADEEGNPILDYTRIDIDKKLKPIIVEEFNNFEYNTENHTAKITGRISGKEQANLVVPAYVWKQGDETPYKVTSINEYYYNGVKTLVTASLPDTITDVPKRSFKDSSVATMILPKSIKTIGYETFYFTNFNTKLNNFYFLGTRLEFTAISKASWWCEGMKNKNAICTDGVISFA